MIVDTFWLTDKLLSAQQLIIFMNTITPTGSPK